MRSIAFLALLLFCCNGLFAQGTQIIQEKRFGTSNSDEAIAAIPLADGGYMMLAQAGNVNLPQLSSWNFSLFRLDANLNELWNINYGGSDYDIPITMVQTNDGGFLMGGYTQSTDGHVSNNYGSADTRSS